MIASVRSSFYKLGMYPLTYGGPNRRDVPFRAKPFSARWRAPAGMAPKEWGRRKPANRNANYANGVLWTWKEAPDDPVVLLGVVAHRLHAVVELLPAAAPAP